MLRAAPRRFRPEKLFDPRSVLLVGPRTPFGVRVAANIEGYDGTLRLAEVAEIGQQEAADLAVLACPAEEVPAALTALGRAGTYAAICLAASADLGAADAAGVRVLGPASFGLSVPARGLNACLTHLRPRPGKVALVSQSASLCRALLDWAEPNGVGFSHVIGTGGSVQTGFAMALDYLSRDPGTGAILLDVRRVRDRHAFLAAARAAARLRPVMALSAGRRLRDPTGREDTVFSAALGRAGVLRVDGFDALLDAAEILTRVRAPRAEPLAIVTNALGLAHVAADAALAQDLPLLTLDAAARAVLGLALPQPPTERGVIWTGAADPMRLAEACAMMAGLPEIGGIVAILSPTGPGDDAAVEALAALRPRVPVLACVPGETTGAPLRRRLAAAGMPAFETPEAAVRGHATLQRQRRARLAASELPTRHVLQVARDRPAAEALIDRAAAQGRTGLTQDESLALLACYGMEVAATRVAHSPEEAVAEAAGLGFPVVLKRRRLARGGQPGGLALDLPDEAAVRRAAERMAAPHGFALQHQFGRVRELRITVHDDPVFGPAIGFGLGGAAAVLAQEGFDLPPLNLTLAHALIRRSRLRRLLDQQTDMPAVNRDAVAEALVRVSELLQDHPRIATLTIDPLFADQDGVRAIDAQVALRPAGERADMAIAPYPAELAQTVDARGERVLIRPIRPEDAEAHAALFTRLTPDDIRFRFFNVMREVSPEQIARMTQVDYDREMAFVAVRPESGETVGVARLVLDPATGGSEFAVVVEPAMKGRGLARALMRKLMEWGRSKGLDAITGQVLAENAPMLGFMRALGATIRRLPEEPEVVEAVIPTG